MQDEAAMATTAAALLNQGKQGHEYRGANIDLRVNEMVAAWLNREDNVLCARNSSREELIDLRSYE